MPGNLTIDPTTGPVGLASVSVTGAGFAKNKLYLVSARGKGGGKEAMTDAHGAFSVVVAPLQGFEMAGTYPIDAMRDKPRRVEATVMLTIT